MFLSTTGYEPGPLFGMKDAFTGLGIFIDTYKNGRSGVAFPYISAMIGTGNAQYDYNEDGKASEFAGCSVRKNRLRGTYEDSWHS